MESFILKLKTKNGQFVINLPVPPETIADLKTELSRVTNILPSKLDVLCGFPPKRLDLNAETKSLKDCNIHFGDTLIIEEKEVPLADMDKSKTKTEIVPKRHVEEQSMGKPGILLKKVVPADNSCLFTSIGFVLGGIVDVTCGSYMRQIIAQEVGNDFETYNEAILGRPNDEYCKWIQRPESWGGAIELAVLSKFYGMEIAVVNTVNAIINRFGEDQLYDHRVFLLFDGVHYDPLYLESVENDGSMQTVFPASDDIMLREAELLAVEAKTTHQYTDLNKFTLKCLQCDTQLVGQDGAVIHARETGHSKFGEVTS